MNRSARAALFTSLALQAAACVADAPAAEDVDDTSASVATSQEFSFGGRRGFSFLHLVTILEVGTGPRTRTDSIGLRHTLDVFGIPYRVTSDPTRAMAASPMIMVAGDLDVAPDQRNALASWASGKGQRTLVTAGTTEPFFLSRIGLDVTAVPAESIRESLTMKASELTTFADTTEERNVRLFPAGKHHSYSLRRPQSGQVVASYEDGGSGIVVARQPGGANVVVLGAPFTDLLTRFEIGKTSPDGCTNAFHASLDTMRLFLRRVYEVAAPIPWQRPLAPAGKRAAVILTHDMDASRSFVGWRDAILPIEQARGYRSTLFVTTSYRDTRWIPSFYGTADTMQILADTRALGFDLQSHSVSHSPDFATFPLGVATSEPTAYSPSYDPATKVTSGGQVRPEVLISKAVLTADLGAAVQGFRAGYLAKPKMLPAAVRDAGYVYDATACAGEVGGSFPFAPLEDYDLGAAETALLELPLSVSDMDIKTRTSDETLAIWKDVTAKNANNGAPTVMLLHPTDPEIKVSAYARWIDWLAQQPDLWVGSMDEYIAWYRARGVSGKVEE